jgi:SAM-dependent methyltransferase
VTQAPRHRRTTFDEDPDTYAAARPDYPTQVYRALVQRCGLGPGTRVLEIGPGTGQATRHLLAAGAHVTAVELGPALAGRLRRDLVGTALTVVEGDFATVTVPDAGFDLGACATAWHWLDPAVAVGKLGRAVRPGGWLAVWWTVFADPDAPPLWRDGLDALFARHLPDQRRGPGQVPRPLQTDARIAELRAGGWFGPVDVRLIRSSQQLTAAGARALFSTFSNIHAAAPGPREAFLDGLAELVAAQPGGVVTDRHVTAMYLTRRRRA